MDYFIYFMSFMGALVALIFLIVLMFFCVRLLYLMAIESLQETARKRSYTTKE